MEYFGKAMLAAVFCVVGAENAAAQDASQWSGAYVGLTYAKGNLDQEYDDGGLFDLEGNGPGLVLGYNHGMGPWVFGGELAYSRVEIGQTDGDPFYFTSFLDLKARGGYAVDNLLLYATIGKTFSKWNESTERFSGDGLLYGVGVDYMISSHFVVGGEYVMRDIQSEWNTSGDTFDADGGTLSVRASYKF